MARPQQPYDDQYGQHDSYYQDDYAQGHPQGHHQQQQQHQQQQHGQYDQGYDQQGDGYYDEKYVFVVNWVLTALLLIFNLLFFCNHAHRPLLVTITMPVSTMPMVNKTGTITMGEAAMRTITMVVTTNTMVGTNPVPAATIELTFSVQIKLPLPASNPNMQATAKANGEAMTRKKTRKRSATSP